MQANPISRRPSSQYSNDVSLLFAAGDDIEDIAAVLAHSHTYTTRTTYLPEVAERITYGAENASTMFERKAA